MSELYPYALTRGTVDLTWFYYPENYFGMGWPDRIGPPQSWGPHVGYDTVDRYTTPGPPWHGEDLETLVMLVTWTPFEPGRGPYFTQLSFEAYDPPPGKRWLQTGAEYEYNWEEPYNIVYWSEYTWGRMNYRFSGTYSLLEKRRVFTPCGSVIPVVAPLLILLPMLSGLAVSNTSTATTGRRRKKV
jgi:hypothetical protein